MFRLWQINKEYVVHNAEVYTEIYISSIIKPLRAILDLANSVNVAFWFHRKTIYTRYSAA